MNTKVLEADVELMAEALTIFLTRFGLAKKYQIFSTLGFYPTSNCSFCTTVDGEKYRLTLNNDSTIFWKVGDPL